MLTNSTIRNVALLLLLIALPTGVIHLFILRFQTGDIYPAYSSLRSDPLGTRAFFDSLNNFEDITVARNYQFLNSLKFEADTTYFYLGAKIPLYDVIPWKTVSVLDGMAQVGGRLVVSYLPNNKKAAKSSCPEEKDEGAAKPESHIKNDMEGKHSGPEKAPVTRPQPDSNGLEDMSLEKEIAKNDILSIKAHWGFGFAYNENLLVKDPEQKHLTLEAISLRPDLPATISWHTNLYFELFDDSWQTLYSVDGNPVIIERPMGKGTIVLCADSFFISNEALRLERQPQLLVWLLGGHSNIVFDESHFGIFQHPGVVGLLRHYRFHWFFGALILVALLFVWKSAVNFVPPREEDISNGAGVMSGKDYTQGLIALLRSNISDRKILQVCGQEWEQTFKNDKRLKSGAVEQIKSILQIESQSSKKGTDPVTGFREISHAIKRLGIDLRNNNIERF